MGDRHVIGNANAHVHLRERDDIYVGHGGRRNESLARAQVAVWDGHYYAIEAMTALGLLDRGGAVRAGMAVYLGHHDVDRLLEVVAAL